MRQNVWNVTPLSPLNHIGLSGISCDVEMLKHRVMMTFLHLNIGCKYIKILFLCELSKITLDDEDKGKWSHSGGHGGGGYAWGMKVNLQTFLSSGVEKASQK
jgi:hypothetical protein